MEIIKFTGGAYIGFAKASWPLATLEVSRGKLRLNASIIGDLVFSPHDIVSIRPYKGFTLIGGGIEIVHNVEKYNSKVLFLTFGDAAGIIRQIHDTGFTSNLQDTYPSDIHAIRDHQATGGFPLKKSVAITYIVLWNLLSLGGILMSFITKDSSLFITGASVAVGIIVVSALLLLISKDFAKFVLKEGRTVDSIKKFIFFVLFIGAFMLLQLLVVFRNW